MKILTYAAIVITLFVLVVIPFGWFNFAPYTVEANDIGDYLGGVFSPLAFLWLVLGYELQRRELVLTREQLKAQATELERSASASTQMLEVQLKSLRRDELRDRIESLPQRVARLISCYQPFLEIGNNNKKGLRPVRFRPDFPANNEPARLKKFGDQLLSSATVWNSRYEKDHGPLPDNLRAVSSNAFTRLEAEYVRLSEWWETCRQLSNDTGLDSLAALGEQCGIEELLKASTICVGITLARGNTSIPPMALKASGTVK